MITVFCLRGVCRCDLEDHYPKERRKHSFLRTSRGASYDLTKFFQVNTAYKGSPKYLME